MKDQKVDKETAAAEFDRWAAAFEIDVNVEDEDDAKYVAAFRAKFMKRVMNGQLAFNDDEESLHFTPRGGESELVFKEPTGELLSNRQKKDTETQSARRALGAWCGVSPVVFAKMPLREFNFCSELLGFFGNS